MYPPVYITGAGIVSALGIGLSETAQALAEGRSGLAPVRHLQTEHREFPVGEVPLTDAEMAARLGVAPETPTTRCLLLGQTALGEALRTAQLPATALPGAAFLSGSTVGGMDRSEQFYQDFLHNDLRNDYIALHDVGTTTVRVADHYGRFGFTASLSTACSSAANALLYGLRLIRSGEWDVVVAGGTESLTRFHLNGFNALLILDAAPCRPFCATRAGLNLGEGAAYVVLESAASVRRRGARPLALLSGGGNACDAFHQTATSPEAEGPRRAMQAALADAGLRPADIDYVNAHGTGTPDNDRSEALALRRVFGDALPPYSSTKSATGHTTSASGAVEAVLCLLALRRGLLPANLNWRVPMDDMPAPVTSPRSGVRLRHVLCNSFGFGGNDSALVLSQLPDV